MLDRFAARSQKNFRCSALLMDRNTLEMRKPHQGRLTDGSQILYLPITHLLVQAANRILMEVRRIAMMLEPKPSFLLLRIVSG